MEYSVNKRVLALRKHLKLTQTEFGESLGVSRDVINNIDNNRVDIGTKHLLLQHICKVYGVNENWLLNGEGAMLALDSSIPSDDVNSRIKYLRKSLGLSMDKFGARVGVSMGVIKNIEYHKVDAKPLFLDMISKEYGVNIEWLKNGTGNMFNDISQKQALSLANALEDSEDCSFALNLISVLSDMSKEERSALKHLLQKVVAILPDDEND